MRIIIKNFVKVRDMNGDMFKAGFKGECNIYNKLGIGIGGFLYKTPMHIKTKVDAFNRNNANNPLWQADYIEIIPYKY